MWGRESRKKSTNNRKKDEDKQWVRQRNGERSGETDRLADRQIKNNNMRGTDSRK